MLLSYVRPFSIHVSTPLSELALSYFIPYSIPHCLLVLLNPVSVSPIWVPICYCRHCDPFRGCSAWICPPQSLLVLLGLESHPVFHSTLPHHHLYSGCPPSTHSIEALLFPLWFIHFSPEFIIIAFYPSFRSMGNLDLNTTIPWYLKSSQMIFRFNFTELAGPNQSQIPMATPAAFHFWRTVCSSIYRPSWSWDSVDDIDAIFDWSHSIT